jgi:hypothetical protein
MNKKMLEKRKKDFEEKFKDPEYAKNSYQNVSPKNRKHGSYDDTEDFPRY